MLPRILAIATLCMTVFSTGAVMAHEGATGVIKERMELMKTIGKNTKVIAPIATGAMDMDLKTVEKLADQIAKNAKAMLDKFPAGSNSHVSEAKDEIWQDWEKFTGLMKDLSTNAAALAKLAKDGEEFELEEAFNKVRGNCRQCHRSFREKDK